MSSTNKNFAKKIKLVFLNSKYEVEQLDYKYNLVFYYHDYNKLCTEINTLTKTHFRNLKTFKAKNIVIKMDLAEKSIYGDIEDGNVNNENNNMILVTANTINDIFNENSNINMVTVGKLFIEAIVSYVQYQLTINEYLTRLYLR